MRVVEARLAKDGEYVICGVTSCGQRLARLDWSIPNRGGHGQTITEAPTKGAWFTSRSTGDGQGYVSFGPGWVQDESGRWRLSKFADQRRRRGKQPSYRRSLPRSPGDEDAPQARRTTVLPAEALCPRCWAPTVNRLTAASLGIVDAVRVWEARQEPPWLKAPRRLPEDGFTLEEMEEAIRWMRATRTDVLE